MPPPAMPADLLLRHANGLRQLARGLVADEHAAEDVLQETWLAALRTPPAPRPGAEAGGVGAWLGGVARRLARKRRRGERRRDERERRVAREEPIASVDEELARREILRHVVEAVLSLEEPYQTVVVLRYYEDLPPRDIAERLGCPVATVKSQLHRARAKLRDRLDGAVGERGQWALALAGVFGWDRALPAAATAAGTGASLGGLAMEWKLAMAVAGLAAVGYVGVELGAGGALADVLPGGSEGRRVVATSAAEGGRAVIAAAPGDEDEAAPGQGRVAVAATATPGRILEGPVAGPYAFAVELEVLDAHDLPAPGVEVDVAPPGHPWTSWGTTGLDGKLRVEWRGHTPAQVLAVGIRSAPDAPIWRLDCRAGTTTRRRFALRPLTLGQVAEPLVEVVDGVAVHEGYRLRAGDPSGNEVRFGLQTEVRGAVELHERASFVERGANVVVEGPCLRESTAGVAGRLFRWPAETVQEVVSANVELVVGTRLHRIRLVPEDNTFELIDVSFGESDELVRVQGVVRDAGGEPVPGAVVVAPGLEHRPTGIADADGAFSLRLPPGGVYELRAGGGDHGQDRTDLDLSELEGGAVASWDPLLDRGHELVGRLVDDTGRALDDWGVAYLRAEDDLPWHDVAPTGADGRFAIPNLPDRAGAVQVRAPEGGGLVTWVFPDVLPGAGEVELVVPAAALEPGRVVARVAGADGEPAQDVQVLLWQESSGRGVPLGFDAKRGAHVRGHVPPGRYRLVAGSPYGGYVTADVVVAAGEVVEVAGLALPPSASVSFTAVPPEDLDEALAVALLRRTEVDSVSATGPVEAPIRAALPPGDYLVYASSGSFGTPAFPFTVRAGENAEHVLDLRTLRPVDVTVAAGEDGAPDAAWSLEIRDAEDRPVLADEAAPAGTARAFLPPGAYVLRATAANGASTEVAFEVADGPTTVRVEAP